LYNKPQCCSTCVALATGPNDEEEEEEEEEEEYWNKHLLCLTGCTVIIIKYKAADIKIINALPKQE